MKSFYVCLLSGLEGDFILLLHTGLITYGFERA